MRIIVRCLYSDRLVSNFFMCSHITYISTFMKRIHDLSTHYVSYWSAVSLFLTFVSFVLTLSGADSHTFLFCRSILRSLLVLSLLWSFPLYNDYFSLLSDDTSISYLNSRLQYSSTSVHVARSHSKLPAVSRMQHSFSWQTISRLKTVRSMEHDTHIRARTLSVNSRHRKKWYCQSLVDNEKNKTLQRLWFVKADMTISLLSCRFFCTLWSLPRAM